MLVFVVAPMVLRDVIAECVFDDVFAVGAFVGGLFDDNGTRA